MACLHHPVIPAKAGIHPSSPPPRHPREGGEVLQRVEHDKHIFAVTLGGPDGKTLFMLAAEFRGVDKIKEVAAARTGDVLISKAPANRAF